MDEYNETEEEINTVYSAVLICVYDVFMPPVTCSLSIFDQQLDWANFC
jgi:hypothetical protein